MDFLVMTEPGLTGNFWNAKYINGVRTAVRECKGSLSELTPFDFEKIAAKKRPESARTPIILNGRSPDWIALHIAYVLEHGFHPILLGTYNNTSQRGVSSLCFDFYGIYTAWCEYMYAHNWRNMALVGVSPDNMSDSLKCEAFRDYNDRQNTAANTEIYCVEDSLQNCCESFIAKAEQFDAVLCTNDVVAIVLVSLLRQKGLKHPLHIHSFWDSPLADHLSPEIKMASLDYHEMGRQAIKLYTFLVNNPGLESVSATVQGKPYPEEKIGNISHVPIRGNKFLQDERAREVYALEQLFSALDEIDLHIIGGMLLGSTYEQIAENALIAVGTVKYRVKKMLSVVQRSNREELLALLDKYLGAENLTGFVKNFQCTR